MIYMKFRRLNKKKYLFYKKNKQSFIVIRPLIQLTRFDTFSLLSFWSLPLYIDQSNYLFFFFCIRLRKQIIPLLKYFFNPNLEKVLKDFTLNYWHFSSLFYSLEQLTSGLRKNPAHLSGTSTISFWESNFLSSLVPSSLPLGQEARQPICQLNFQQRF